MVRVVEGILRDVVFGGEDIESIVLRYINCTQFFDD